MVTSKRYQVYLDPRSVSVLDEMSQAASINRSQIIREVSDAAANRIGNLLAAIKPQKSGNYSWMQEMVGSITLKNKKIINVSERVDDIYYDK